MNEQDKIKAAKIVDRLYQKTLKGSITWDETSDKNAFQANVGNYIVQVIKEYDGESEDWYSKVLLRSYDGNLIDEILPSHLREIESSERPDLRFWQIFDELHESARRYALGVDKAYDELLSIL
jgi:hypothetical protein